MLNVSKIAWNRTSVISYEYQDQLLVKVDDGFHIQGYGDDSHDNSDVLHRIPIKKIQPLKLQGQY